METTNTNIDTSLLEPFNPLDPVVVNDPVNMGSTIIKKYAPNDDPDYVSETTANSDATDIKTSGILHPIVKINNFVIPSEDIENMSLLYNDFLPEIELTITDYNNKIQFSDVPGMNNSLSVILLCSVDGIYKKVSLDFYITYCDFTDNIITYKGIFNFGDLNKTFNKQIGSGKISTYELLNLISKDTGLGFAATPSCEKISDVQYRLIHSIKLKDYIIEQLIKSGNDENGVMDAWIDLFGYIVLVDVKNVMETPIDSNQLTLNSIFGDIPTDSYAQEQEIITVNRTLTNDRHIPKNSLLIEKYENVVFTDNVIDNGALNNFYYMTGPENGNKIVYKQLQMIENSVDGISGSSDYEFENIKYIGVDFNDTPVLFQKEINKNYLNKLRTNQLEIKLENVNYGIQRGTLINVIIKDYDPAHKRKIYNNFENSFKESQTLDTNEETNLVSNDANDSSITEIIEDDTKGLINPSLSGMYYIDSMKFEYSNEEHQIKQYLYLIKRGKKNNLINKYTAPKYNI